MSLLYSEYFVGLPQGEVFGRLRQSVAKAGWVVEEESGFSLFLIKGRTLLSQTFRGSACRLAVTIGHSDGGAMLRFVGWTPRMESYLHDEIWKLLAAAEFTTFREPTPGRIPVYWNPNTVRPSWVRWTKAVGWSWAVLLVPLLVFSIWLGWPLMLVFLIPGALTLMLGPTLVVDGVSRHILGVQSRRGMLTGSVVPVLHLVVAVALPFVFRLVY